MAEIVYPPVIAAARTLFRVLDIRFHTEGTEHVPRTGGAVLVSNHISYLDFIFAGFAALPSKRLVRFMAKQDVFDHRISGPLMRGMHHIPVDRGAGAGSYATALRTLKAGEVVGVFAEATISRSFTVKEIKNGAIRMAQATNVPVIPVALWGSQRLWTKGRPKKLLQRHVPLTILVGEPMHPKRGENVNDHVIDLHTRLSELVDRAQRTYPDVPQGVWWQPAHLGGTAPTPEEAAAMDAAEAEARAKQE
ncbi:1-acyl-sn-glycerol-3-phosphate acyltransferase [Nonomuraea sp. KC401]|uniref:lysophospholipid acyltransferase family protein n=1 Tax=unclassified Nonomuraea TaxID=2593643 RepID=UPI0010FF503C|nr:MULTISPECIES: lysophospholipid acyltransferase family protein [unclassified Nonomuraea]NBE98949.1 1-acyl-sn-glycerol-3-phosphate acyltransferase [Nonomuraea sp. K271]TLF57914.1 1-acyl-sn-glycerol-3-phosphate acyltransferase [Nonomuraea sp. KC401]